MNEQLRDMKRLVLLPLPCGTLAAVVGSWLDPRRGAPPAPPAVPEGSTVVGVGWADSLGCHAVKLHNQAFAPVPEGALIPSMWS
jgi:hypothetical protein